MFSAHDLDERVKVEGPLFTISFNSLGRLFLQVMGVPEESIKETQAFVTGLVLLLIFLLVITIVANLGRE
jgi:hypothetical protein